MSLVAAATVAKPRRWRRHLGLALASALLGGCGGGDAPQAPGSYSFPLGVSDSRLPDGTLVVATTAQRSDGREADIGVTLQLSPRSDFFEITHEVPQMALRANQYRLQVALRDLPPSAQVYYRFKVDNDTSPVGRATTGPRR
jgi:phosphodiesterase/alkaline phosphatase D-like protein